MLDYFWRYFFRGKITGIQPTATLRRTDRTGESSVRIKSVGGLVSIAIHRCGSEFEATSCFELRCLILLTYAEVEGFSNDEFVFPLVELIRDDSSVKAGNRIKKSQPRH